MLMWLFFHRKDRNEIWHLAMMIIVRHKRITKHLIWINIYAQVKHFPSANRLHISIWSSSFCTLSNFGLIPTASLSVSSIVATLPAVLTVFCPFVFLLSLFWFQCFFVTFLFSVSKSANKFGFLQIPHCCFISYYYKIFEGVEKCLKVAKKTV